MAIIETTGFEAFIKDFQRLERKLQISTVRETLKEASVPIANAARSKVPVGDTGELQDSIQSGKVRLSRKKRGQYYLIIGSEWGSDVEYGFFVETGHKIGARKGNVTQKTALDGDGRKVKIVTDKRKVYVEPQPWLRPAVDENKDLFFKIVSENVINALTETMGR